ncbi:hypothetical protein [Sporosarcina sp. FA9]|uniref:hypothetical protein n=1 Tax=Sporosarcina sp. FA9 TaxID=3413030 RepID=UPI003F656E9E
MKERIEKERNYIRNNWFKDHVATVTEHDGVTILDWRKPGTFMYALRYVMVGNKLFISGDIGDAVYDLTWNATIESFDTVNLSYFTGKLSCNSREKYDFNNSLAQQEIKECFIDWCDVDDISDLEEDDKELYDELISATMEWSSHEQFSSMGVWTAYNNTDCDWFESEVASSIADCGKELSNVFIAYLLGVQMANEQIKKVVVAS